MEPELTIDELVSANMGKKVVLGFLPTDATNYPTYEVGTLIPAFPDDPTADAEHVRIEYVAKDANTGCTDNLIHRPAVVSIVPVNNG